MGNRPPEPLTAYERRAQADVIFDCHAALAVPDPGVVDVVHGRTKGFGCTLAALCDITLANAAVTFQLPETAHGIMPTIVMSCMADRVSRKVLMYLAYSTKVIDAPRALSMGIVSDVFAEEA